MRRKPDTRRFEMALACLLPLALAACQGEAAAPVKKPVVVRAEAARLAAYEPTVTLTGDIRAQVQGDLSFRVSGRIAERRAEVGDHVTADHILARIDPQEQQAMLNSAQATVQAAEAQLRQASSAFERQKALLERGYTTRREYDAAEEAFRTSQSSLDSANAQLATARDQLSYTVLRAGTPGIITARNAEAGQVVQAAQAVFSLAQDGARDAVFYLHESAFSHDLARPEVEIALVADPNVKVTGRVREVSPSVDASNGTVRIKIGLNGGSALMPLGAAVTGTARLASEQVTRLPAGALTSSNGQPAVWTIDPASKAVALRPVALAAYATRDVLIRSGLSPDAIVVTAGAQFLTPGQIVTALGAGEP